MPSPVAIPGFMIAVYLANPTGGEQYSRRPQRLDSTRFSLQGIQAQQSILLAGHIFSLGQPAIGDQVNGVMVFEQGDVRASSDRAEQGRFDSFPSGIGDVQNAPLGMTALAA